MRIGLFKEGEKMRRLFFIVDIASGVILTDAYQTKSGLLHDYNVDSGETVVELNYEDMVTDKQKDEFERLWSYRVQR